MKQVTSRSARTITAALAAATIAGLTAALAAAAAHPWSGATYQGHGTGVWTQNTIRLTVAPSGTSIPTYTFEIDSLCGTVDGPAGRTAIWPFTNQGSPAIRVAANGRFASTQNAHLTVPRIPGVTSGPAPGAYHFVVSGAFRANGTFSGRLTLRITTTTGYFCSDTNSPFAGRRVG